jgi:uncharacterized protein YpmB
MACPFFFTIRLLCCVFFVVYGALRLLQWKAANKLKSKKNSEAPSNQSETDLIREPEVTELKEFPTEVSQ